jgi:signal transduction histidine kinase
MVPLGTSNDEDKMNREVSGLRKKLIFTGLIIMLAGMSSGILIYQSAGNDADSVLGYEIIGGSSYPIRPEDSRIYRRDLELYGGKAAVLADEFSRWFVGLWRGTTLTFTVTGISIFISFVFFLAGTKKMSSLIYELLSFSRIQKAGMTISEIDMNELVNEAWDEVRLANQERELELKITKLMPGFGDRALIRQVIFNLMSNAVKFSMNRKPGIIEISSYRDADKVVYCLKDNGVGFDMFYYDKLFGKFQRLHNPAEYAGTGIGLALVRSIITRHNGRVWAEGEVGKGATFYFTLPSTQTK